MAPGPRTSSCSIAMNDDAGQLALDDARRRGRPSPVPAMTAALPAWISHRHFWR